MKLRTNLPTLVELWVIAISLLTFVLGSCNKFLDIIPDGQVLLSEQLKTEQGIEDALYGVYAQMRTDALYGGNMNFSGMDVLAQQLDCYNNTSITALNALDYSHSAVESTFGTVWTQMYNNISNVNAVLTSELLKAPTSFPYTIYRGEALALRAFMHFDLTRIFAPVESENGLDGIPYQTDFSLITPEFETLQQNYSHILTDLNEAEALLADEYEHQGEGEFMKDRPIHINLDAVRATLARVHLTMGDKQKAAEYALKVIESGRYRLTEKNKLQGDASGYLSKNETIFGLYDSKLYASISPLLQQMISFSSLDPRDDIQSVYENQDVAGVDFRFSAYFTAVPSGSSVEYRLSRFTDPYELQGLSASRPSDLILGMSLIRLPEMYYVAAECLIDTDYDRAVSYFNQVSASRGLEPLVSWNNSPKLTPTLIDTERYKEMFGEGQDFFNKKRLGLSLLSTDGKTIIPMTQSVAVLPIPDNEYENRY